MPNAGNIQSVPNSGNHATGAKREKQTIGAIRGKSCNRYQTQEIMLSVPNAGNRQSVANAGNILSGPNAGNPVAGAKRRK